MRSTCSLYVDAGYLLAAAATRVTGTSLRGGIHVDYRSLVQCLIAEAEERSGLPLLRVHWYDSARDAVPDPQQVRIGELRKVKLRLGRFGREGQQKGVDVRIGLDLVTHAGNAAADVFLLVSGDDDLTEAVEEAQSRGVEVIILAVPDSSDRPHGVSRHLLRAADDIDLLAGSVIDESVSRAVVPTPSETATPDLLAAVPQPVLPDDVVVPPRPSPSDLAAMRRRLPTAPAAATTLAYQGSSAFPSRVMPGYEDPTGYDDEIDEVVAKVLAAFRQSASAEEMAALVRSKPSVPRELDRALLVDLSDRLDVYDLTDPIRYRLRERFWRQCD